MVTDDLELLHNFIHDLKAPLSSARSFVELVIASGDLNNDQKRYAHRAMNNMDRMHGIISNLLEYARMEADADLDIDVCNTLEILHGVIELVGGQMKERQITVNINIIPAAQFVQADEQLLESVLLNLITNAIKYNKIGGKINISSENAGEFVRIIIQDTGLGIPDDAVPHVFDRFYRVNSKKHMEIEGTGLGLAMVRRVIEKHGGEITVESTLNEGSVFAFTMPHASTSSPEFYDREPMDGLPDEFQEDHDAEHDDRDSGEQPR